ncbi:Protein T19A5.3 a [Aphelenchoides avenae]|nr:Protein T19A5.3 a [Aphelenchus avenae]
MTVEKRFKLVTNKVAYRPRLKIRRPGEQFARGDSNAQKSAPISLPELTPFRSQPSAPRQRRPLQSAENTDEPRLPPRRVLPHVSSAEAPFPERPRNRKLPAAAPTFDSAETGSASSSDGDGESGSNFGGDLGTPPPGFGDAFGLSGAETLFGGGNAGGGVGGGGRGDSSSENFIPEEPEQFTTTAAPPKPPSRATPKPRPRPTAPPPPEEFVVPENSGLRPVAPPTELRGGFGSRSGSPLSGFGGGGGGGFGGGGGGRSGPAPPSSPRRPPPKRPAEPVEPEPKEEDFFTGESAFTPNKRGPTGDGYGPAVFPGAALPPPVPSVSVGGDAAGISPYKTQQLMEVTENTPTTVKPSALLNILNKADQGFNQVINHFEQGTPLEATAIDILEVALGSQKLDSQAKILHHLDRTIGLDNLQRLQRWANTGGALDMFKEEFLKFAKNYKPPPETKAITIPPQLEYLFQNPSG